MTMGVPGTFCLQQLPTCLPSTYPEKLLEWPKWPASCPQMPPWSGRWAHASLTTNRYAVSLQEIYPCLCRKLEQDNKDLKNQLATVQANLTYAERLKKEADQQCAEARVECTKAQQIARHYEVQFSQNLKPQYEALQRENAQLREQLGESLCGLQGWSGGLWSRWSSKHCWAVGMTTLCAPGKPTAFMVSF